MTDDRAAAAAPAEPHPRPYRPAGLEDAFEDADRPQGSVGRADSSDSGRPVAGRGDGPLRLPALGVVGWLRWVWRQVTSMRVALLLLMLLAVAAVPGTIFPQRAVDAGAVATYLSDHPDLGPVLDRLGFFAVYSSTWFSAIYLLLFLSLVGCILPRSRTHLRGLRARPPRAPRRFTRFPAQGEAHVDGDAEQVARSAAAALRGPRGWRRFRVDVREEAGGVWSVAAERGYLRETGNLVFHLALVGLLASIAVGQLLHFRGQAIIVEGRSFANAQSDYDTFEAGAAFDATSLEPFSMRLDSFESVFDSVTLLSRDFTAEVTLTEPGQTPRPETIKVNQPLVAGGAKVYLQGNGYAPEITVRGADGQMLFAGVVPFLPQDTVYTSQGVIKVPDVTSGPQFGLQGVLLPTAVELGDEVWQSVDPQPRDPLLALSVWVGDLGLDDGIPQNVYQLDESGLTQSMTQDGSPLTLYLRPGETVDLPDGLGTIEFGSLPRFAAFDLRHDPSLVWVLVFSLVAFAGMSASLFVPRRRVWLRCTPADQDGRSGAGALDPQDQGPKSGRTVVAAAALARGDDVGLQAELDRALDRLTTTAQNAEPSGRRSMDKDGSNGNR